jgi:hypothetical protein
MNQLTGISGDSSFSADYHQNSSSKNCPKPDYVARYLPFTTGRIGSETYQMPTIPGA